MSKDLNILYSKTVFFFTSLFLLVSTLTFSWIPLTILIPILLLLLFFKILYVKIDYISYIFIIGIMILIFFTVNKQLLYIELVRNYLIAFLIPTVYLMFTNISIYRIYQYIYYIYLASFFVVLYIIIVYAPQDLALFFGERRGFIAREYLIFGREYPFSLGVTHLNVYVTFLMTFLMISMINNIQNINKKTLLLLFFLVVLISLLTQSRSPILYLFIIYLIYRQYIYSSRKNKLTYFVLRIMFLTPVVFFSYLLIDIFYIQITNSDRLNDLSRFIFYIKGYEHMIEEPWGNSLLYTDIKMPLLNYHNTFLAMGNRIAYAFFVVMIVYLLLILYMIRGIKSKKSRYTMYLLLYYCFHNFMIEDIIVMDYFVFIIFIAIFPIIRNIKKEEKYLKVNVI